MRARRRTPAGPVRSALTPPDGRREPPPPRPRPPVDGRGQPPPPTVFGVAKTARKGPVAGLWSCVWGRVPLPADRGLAPPRLGAREAVRAGSPRGCRAPPLAWWHGSHL